MNVINSVMKIWTKIYTNEFIAPVIDIQMFYIKFRIKHNGKL